MSDIKNYEAEEKNVSLKQADAEKSDNSNSDFSQVGMKEVLTDKLGKNISLTRNAKKQKKNLPLVADIAVGVLLVIIAIGIVVGTYYLFGYYSDAYGEVSVEYTFISYSDSDPSVYRTMKNKEFFMDTEDNTLYFGKISEVTVLEDTDEGNVLIFTVDAKVKYRQGSGYMIGDNKIAIGSEYRLRSEALSVDGTIVELTVPTDRSNGGN